jgi:hypothetical protein
MSPIIMDVAEEIFILLGVGVLVVSLLSGG